MAPRVGIELARKHLIRQMFSRAAAEVTPRGTLTIALLRCCGDTAWYELSACTPHATLTGGRAINDLSGIAASTWRRWFSSAPRVNRLEGGVSPPAFGAWTSLGSQCTTRRTSWKKGRPRS